MSRPVVLVFGALLWGSFAVVTLVHVASGQWMVPLASVIVVGTVVAAYHTLPRVFAAARGDVD
jgi:hypothetical protein